MQMRSGYPQAITLKPQVASRQIGGQPNLQMIHIVYQLMTVYTTCVYGEEGPVPTRDAQ